MFERTHVLLSKKKIPALEPQKNLLKSRNLLNQNIPSPKNPRMEDFKPPKIL